MRKRIIYLPGPRRSGKFRRIPFTPLSQEPPAPIVGIGKQILDYLKFGKPLTAPVTPIKTEIIVPPETKKFIRNTVFTAAGVIVGGIILYQALK